MKYDINSKKGCFRYLNYESTH